MKLKNIEILLCLPSFCHSMLHKYELKIFKLQYLLNPVHHYKTENLKFSKMHKKSSHVKCVREF